MEIKATDLGRKKVQSREDLIVLVLKEFISYLLLLPKGGRLVIDDEVEIVKLNDDEFKISISITLEDFAREVEIGNLVKLYLD